MAQNLSNDHINLTMLTDFYEITMANGYFANGFKDTIGYFDMFFRKVPDGGGFAIMAGVEQLVNYLSELSFTQEDIDYLRSKHIFREEFLDYLKNFKFTCDVWAVPEGTPIFPGEPIVTVRGPVIQAQFVETMVLLSINHQSLIATKTNRIVRAADGRAVMEFGSRRAQGFDGAIYGARAAYIGGCIGTACTISDRRFGVPALGTMAHSWVQLFDSEYEAFKAYAEEYPHNCTLLVDTYNVLKSGVPNAIRVFNEVLVPQGFRPAGIRIDSGDLAYLSKKAYQMLEAEGFGDAIISASSDLDEYLIDSLKTQGAKINSWGVGTNLITSGDWPAFGGVYKLAAAKDKDDAEFTPKIKLSENSEKVTNPGNKTIYRIYDKETGKIRADLICLADETFDESKDMIIFDPIETWKKTKIKGGTYTLRELLVPIFQKGACVYTSPSVMEIRDICTREKDTLWEESKRLVNPHEVYVDLSDKLYHIKSDLLEEMSMKALGEQ